MHEVLGTWDLKKGKDQLAGPLDQEWGRWQWGPLLSRFVIAFLLRSKRLLISWLQSPSSVILEPKKMKSVTVSLFSAMYLP